MIFLERPHLGTVVAGSGVHMGLWKKLPKNSELSE